jgi:hypothetical protein
MKKFNPNFSLYWYATTSMGAIGLLLGLILMVCELILLVRMNNQQCIPEVSMWEYFRVAKAMKTVMIYAGLGLVVSILLDLTTLITWQPKWNIKLPVFPKSVLKVLEVVMVILLIVTAVFLVGFLVWALFIKNPC